MHRLIYILLKNSFLPKFVTYKWFWHGARDICISVNCIRLWISFSRFGPNSWHECRPYAAVELSNRPRIRM